ncbi:MAG: FecR domain-containing protein, partial [Planctomycetes bacterium]|nr:FecR domain-containing protein [Planctomycetota bacterium]
MSSEPRPSPESSLSCGEAQREIDLLIEDGDLKETERSLLFSHLRTCENCKSSLEARRRLDVRLRNAFLNLDTSPGFARRVLESLPAAQAAGAAEPSAWMAAAQTAHSRRDDTPVFGLAWLTRGYRLPAALAALIAVGLCGMLYRYYSLQGQPEEVAQILKIEGEGAGERIRAGRNVALKEGQFLLRGDEISAETEGGKPLVLGLAFRGQLVATVHLKPGAVLRAVSRHQFALNKGEAYFQVRKDRPKEAPNERFKVETPLGSVQVTGTEFGVIVPAEVPQYVTVLVSEGSVEVLPNAGAGSTLALGDEADLLNGGGVSALRPAVSTRLAWVQGAVQLAALPTPSVRPSPAQPDLLTPQTHTAPPAAQIDWQAPAPPIDFTGLHLPQALTVLAQRLGGSAVLLDLAKQAESLGAAAPSTLNLRHALPLGAVVRWLARENRLRFVATGRLRAAEPAEALGPIEDGAPPVRIAQALDAKLAAPLAARKENLAALLSEVAARAGACLYLNPGDSAPLQAAPPEFNPWRGTLRGELEDAVRSNELDWAFFDGLL